MDWATEFQRNRSQLVSLAVSILGPNDAEDAVQQAFLNVYKADSFHGQCSPFTYLYRCTINTCLMVLRKRRRHPTELCADIPELVDHEPNPEQIVSEQELLDLAGKILQQFPQTTQNILQAKTEGLTFAEIEQQLGVKVSTAKCRYYRAARQLVEECGL